MTTKRQLRVELADAQTTISALRATVAAASEDRDRAVAEMADVSRKLTERSNRLDTFADAIADQDAKLTEATTQLAERGEALRIALEQAARVPALCVEVAGERERVALHEKRTAFWHGTAQHQKRRAEAMTRVGDRMAANANAQTRKEWEAAKEGRSLRGPDGRWLKAEGPPPRSRWGESTPAHPPLVGPASAGVPIGLHTSTPVSPPTHPTPQKEPP